jgi:hypothetical protein
MPEVQLEKVDGGIRRQPTSVVEKVGAPDGALRMEPSFGVGEKHHALRLFDEMSQYRNQLVVDKLHADLSISPTEANVLFEDVKRFIALCVTTPQPLAPPRIVDQAWHQFILTTRDYFYFCDRHCGRYVHHQPADPFAAAKDYSAERRRTRLLAEAVFGTLSPNWNESETGAKCTHNCGTGDIGVPIA